MHPTPEQILDDVAAILVEILGDDLALEPGVTREATFSEDLALESIEFVALAERLDRRYGGRVDFVAFLADMDMDEITGMTVGRLVDHIAHCLAAPGEGER